MRSGAKEPRIIRGPLIIVNDLAKTVGARV